MNYRTLGKTGLKVSEIGFGSWQLANHPDCWVGSDLNESLKCLQRFVDLGGNFIDTAWVYGYSKDRPDEHPSEQLIGKFLKESGMRDKVVIATKVSPKNMHWPARKGVPISEVFPSDHIERCVNDSLRSLGVDAIDLVQFHVWQDDFSADTGWQRTVQRLSDEGKVRHWGISVNDYEPANCLKALDTGLISTVQLIFNVFHQRPISELFPYARRNNIGLIARVPLDEGGLTGKFNRNTKFEDGDFRKDYFSPDRLAELERRTDGLKGLLGSESSSLAELALRFTLSFDEISTAIPGMRRLAYVDQNASVSDGRKLSQGMLKALEGRAWERNFYTVW